MSLLSVRREVGEFRKRYKWMALVVLLVFGGLYGRMIQLQLIEYDRWSGIAIDNITRTVTLSATRGVVRDLDGRLVATNRPAYSVYLIPQYLRDEDIGELSDLLSLDDEARVRLREKVEGVPERRRSHQIQVLTDISRNQLAALETHERDLCTQVGSGDRRRRLPCVAIRSEPIRTYPFGRLAAHAVGYLNEMNAEELARLRPAGYRLGDRIGRTGIERAWESYLRGRRGYQQVLVNAGGQRVSADRSGDQIVRREPVPGRDINLTIDMELMQIVERAFRGHPTGAVVVVDVQTGAIRALFSKPSYDLSAFTTGLSHAQYGELRDDPFRPLIDKTIYESYFPGSTFKPFSALAALREGVLDRDTRFECAGSYTLGHTRFRCTSIHGEVNLRESLVQSCNVYFYRLAEQVGLNRLARLAGDFGLGRPTGVGINTEASGFIPTRDFYERGGRRFRLGYTLNSAIGQGDTKVTLTQLTMAYAAIANGGTLYVPQLVDRITGPDGTVVEQFEPRVRRRVHVSPEHLALVVDGLYGVVNNPTGTAHAARIDGGVTVAGKTGTAQVSRRSRPDRDPQNTWYFNRSHAWFAGFAPVESPELAIVVLVEHGGAGGRHAAPIGIQILEEYLGSRRQAEAEAEAEAAAQEQEQ